MKKHSLLLFLCTATLLASCGSSSNSPRVITDTERDGLRGDVRCLREKTEMKVYNGKGWITEMYELPMFSKDNKMRLEKEYIYAEDSCTRIARKEYSYDYKGEQTSEIIPDTLTVEQRMLSFFDDKDTEYTFNSNGDIIKSYKLKDGDKENAKKEYIIEYVYDDNNRLIEVSNSFFRNVPAEEAFKFEYILHTYTKDLYEYNEQGDMIKNVTLDKDGKEINTYEWHYTYDDNGNWVSHSNPHNAAATEREVFNAEQYDAYKKAAAEAAKNENFDNFLKMFAGSKSFQIERIAKFPIGNSTFYDLDGSQEVTKITKSVWNSRGYFTKATLSCLKDPMCGGITKNSETSYTCESSSDGGAVSSVAKFERKDGKWYLVNFTTSSY